MYFFDFNDFCINQAIGSNSTNLFITPYGGPWSDIESTFRNNRNALLSSVAQWYDLSKPRTITYQYDSSVNLSWPSNTNYYTLYSGPWTFSGTYGDDGHTTNPILLDTVFEMNNVASSNLYIGSNGYITLGSGSDTRLTVPSVGPPATICGNPGDNWLNAGVTSNSDGDMQNAWYQTGSDGSGKYYVKVLVYSGTYGNITSPTSWIGNLYRDSQYQWFEARAKSNLRGNSGPFNASSVAQPSSTTSKVWRGDLNGQNWQYMGTGSVTAPRICTECDTYFNQFTATTATLSNFWTDAEFNFDNTTDADVTTYFQNVYHQQCLLKQLIKCVDGDTFPTFNNTPVSNFE